MHKDITRQFADIAISKTHYLKSNPPGYFISTLMGGAYNLLRVSVGNIIGGAGFIGVAYYLTSNSVFSFKKK